MQALRKQYIFHCDKCNVMILKEQQEKVKCPVWKTKKLDGFPMTIGIADYKQDRNYPQYAPNLGEVVTSYDDYKKKLVSSGHEIVGKSDESKKRMKFLKRKAKMFNTRDYVYLDMNKKETHARKF